ncbi:uncharacterized protein LOC130285592 isoform X2 [Hyla sarda]|uniref:uncharacterized protein LOC130285592 isoform X2 n=1 Tax=Hyla sarda TaxID=327740 RepID=UPI0024C30EDE|nr:uncharacterized protein LOC130285592 isoform X2 [Hyla sarda]
MRFICVKKNYFVLHFHLIYSDKKAHQNLQHQAHDALNPALLLGTQVETPLAGADLPANCTDYYTVQYHRQKHRGYWRNRIGPEIHIDKG